MTNALQKCSKHIGFTISCRAKPWQINVTFYECSGSRISQIQKKNVSPVISWKESLKAADFSSIALVAISIRVEWSPVNLFKNNIISAIKLSRSKYFNRAVIKYGPG